MVRLLGNHQQVACAADCVVGFRHDGRVPIERLDLLDETALVPSASLVDRIFALDEGLRGVLGLHASGVAGDEALVKPLVDGLDGVGQHFGIPVDVTPVQLPVVDELGVGILGNELPPQPHHAVFLRVGCNRGHAGVHELLAGVHELVVGGRNLDVVLGEQVLVVVDALEFSVAGHTVPGIAVHDAVLVVLGDCCVCAGHLLVPAVLLDIVAEVGEQAHGGEHAGGAVAAVGFHEVWRFVGVQELAAVLRDLGERLSFEVDLDAGLFFEGLGRATPSLSLACVVLFVIPERQAVRLFLILGGIATTCGEGGQRQCCDGQCGQSSFDVHCYSPCFLLEARPAARLTSGCIETFR